MRHLLLLILSFTLFSCARPTKDFMEVFRKKSDLKLTKLEQIPSDVLGKPRDIFIVRDYFIIQDEIDNNWYTLLNKNTGELVCHFGVMGRGPQELLYPVIQEPYQDNFYVYDGALETLHMYSLDSLLAKKANGITKSTKIHFTTKQHAECRQLTLLESGEIIANCCHPDGHLVLFDTNGTEKKAFYPEYPYDPLHKEENYIPKSFAFQYNCIADPKNQKLFNVSTTTGHIEVFDIHKDSLDRKVDELYYLPDYKNTCNGDNFSVLFSKDHKRGLFNPEATDKYLYAAYQDQPAPHTYIAFDVLFKFDRNGKPVEQYKLSNRISRFFIDHGTGILYAISSDPETLEPHIYQAQIE